MMRRPRALPPAFLALAFMALSLTACGYRLVGGGAGGIGWLAGSSVAVTGDDAAMTRDLREALARAGVRLAEDEAKADKRIRLHLAPAEMTPAAYDSAGAPVQYRLSLRGSLEAEARMEGDWRVIWRSGELVEAGDVYVSGGPASIEAARERQERDLRAAWLARALSGLRSGF